MYQENLTKANLGAKAPCAGGGACRAPNGGFCQFDGTLDSTSEIIDRVTAYPGATKWPRTLERLWIINRVRDTEEHKRQ